MLDRLVDSLGDLTLVVGPEQTRIRVSRHALRLASPVWNAMLTPNHFQESSSSEIPLEDDDTEALRILLLVAHHRNNILPTKFDSLHKLVEVALLCAQYQMVLVMKRFMDVWKAPWSTVRKEGSWWFVDDVPGCEEMLVIYWIFGYVDHYYKLSATLWPFVKPVYGSDQGDVEVRGRAFLQGKMPAGVIDVILSLRQEAIDGLFVALAKLTYVRLTPEYTWEHNHYCPENDARCNKNQNSALLKIREVLGWWPLDHVKKTA